MTEEKLYTVTEVAAMLNKKKISVLELTKKIKKSFRYNKERYSKPILTEGVHFLSVKNGSPKFTATSGKKSVLVYKESALVILSEHFAQNKKIPRLLTTYTLDDEQRTRLNLVVQNGKLWQKRHAKVILSAENSAAKIMKIAEEANYNGYMSVYKLLHNWIKNPGEVLENLEKVGQGQRSNTAQKKSISENHAIALKGIFETATKKHIIRRCKAVYMYLVEKKGAELIKKELGYSSTMIIYPIINQFLSNPECFLQKARKHSQNKTQSSQTPTPVRLSNPNIFASITTNLHNKLDEYPNNDSAPAD